MIGPRQQALLTGWPGPILDCGNSNRRVGLLEWMLGHPRLLLCFDGLLLALYYLLPHGGLD